MHTDIHINIYRSVCMYRQLICVFFGQACVHRPMTKLCKSDGIDMKSEMFQCNANGIKTKIKT